MELALARDDFPVLCGPYLELGERLRLHLQLRQFLILWKHHLGRTARHFGNVGNPGIEFMERMQLAIICNENFVAAGPSRVFCGIP